MEFERASLLRAQNIFSATSTTARLPQKIVRNFQEMVLAYYQAHGRTLPWRETNNAYAVLVSEIMLQQTQVDRVIPKYAEFLARFPDFKTLAAAPVSDVLIAWQGLGYNRRALFLKRIAETICQKYACRFPDTFETLRQLPGIGAYSAAALLAFIYNKPATVIETNIRTVYLFFFFPRVLDVSDTKIITLIEQTLDYDNPRTWYWGLMDFGSMLKKEFGNFSRQSKHYHKQSPLEGSDRQIRGLILKVLSQDHRLNIHNLIEKVGKDEKRTRTIITELKREGFLREKQDVVSLA